jgi:exodeoxyribonuclease III
MSSVTLPIHKTLSSKEFLHFLPNSPGPESWRRSICGARRGLRPRQIADTLFATGGVEATMKIATFNINGIRARIEALPAWLAAASPDVVLLQEIKSIDEGFPREMFEDMGYQVETHGQKSFNGVAILSKLPLEDVSRGLPGDESDEQARWIEATIAGKSALRLCGLYLPNGNPAPGPKYDYKLAWMERLRQRASDLLATEMPVMMAGDYNIIPQSEDAARPEAWRDDALFLPQSREAFRRIVNLGFTEAFRTLEPRPGYYSFWDYQAGAWEKNNGIRIDHLLLSPQAADRMTDCGIDKQVRGGDKPSDHVPVWVELDL